MTKTILLAAVIVSAASGAAQAGGQAKSLGVGAEFGLNGETGGVSLNYDAGMYHFGGFLGFKDGFDGNDNSSNDTSVTLGGRFYWHVHRTAMSDFGIGGALGWFSAPGSVALNGTVGPRINRMYLEPGFQIRLFVAANVALSFSAGISLGFVDANGLSLGSPSVANPETGFGLVSGAAGVHYYFF